MKKEDELKDLEKEYKALTKRCAIANSKFIKLQDEVNTVRHKIENLTKNIWDEKAKSLIGKYIAWEEGDYFYFFHVVQSNKSNIIGEMISHYYYFFDGDRKLDEIRYKPHCWQALNGIDRGEGMKKLKEGTLYKEITEEEFILRKTTLNRIDERNNMNTPSDNRDLVIQRAKEHLLKATNIEDRQEEMQVIDNILLRCWQMGWLKQYE